MSDDAVGLPPAASVTGSRPVALAASSTDLLVCQVQQILTEHLQIAAPSPDTDIIDSGALDSFAMVELLVTVEERFGVEVAVDELDVDDFRSARSIASLIAAQARGGPLDRP